MKRSVTFVGRILVLVVACLAVTVLGCAFGDRKISLTYEPLGEFTLNNPGAIAVAEFVDARDDKLVVGEVRNGYGMKTADVIAENQSAGGWVANALGTELEKSGFKVSKVLDAASTTEPIVISGSVSEVFVTMSLNLRSTVRASVRVTNQGVAVLNKEYVGKAKKFNAFGTSKEQEATLRMGLQDLVRQIVPDIVEV